MFYTGQNDTSLPRLRENGYTLSFVFLERRSGDRSSISTPFHPTFLFSSFSREKQLYFVTNVKCYRYYMGFINEVDNRSNKFVTDSTPMVS